MSLPITVTPLLDQLETAGLVELAHNLPELAYMFRHNLVHDAAYSSLLRQDRRRLHALVGTIPEMYAAFTRTPEADALLRATAQENHD